MKNWSLYLMGESYAGVYVPFIAGAIQFCNNLPGANKMNFRGIGVGGGVLNFKIQESFASKFQLNKLFKSPEDDSVRNSFGLIAEDCRNIQLSQAFDAPYHCDMYSALQAWYDSKQTPAGETKLCINFYNIHGPPVPCDSGSNGYYLEENQLSALFNTRDLRKAAHLEPNLDNLTWTECSNISITLFGDSFGPSSDSFLPTLVAEGIKVLIWSGEFDFVVNYVGTEEVLGNLTWGGLTGFLKNSSEWIVGSNVAGRMWSERGLTYVRVNGAGHMVPADNPTGGAALLQELLGVPPRLDDVSNKRLEIASSANDLRLGILGACIFCLTLMIVA
ncbi:Cell death protease [Entophlyctis luteolus]|nr:Cell death protease [Entophlyctis luteolus]